MMSEFKDKIVLITGASKGLGRAFAKKFIDQGAQVVGVARTIKELETLDDYARTKNNKIIIVPLDLKDHHKIDELGYDLYKKFGKVDILISCAAILGALSPVGHIDPKVWQNIIDVNLSANYRLIRSIDPLLRRSEAGRAIFIISEAAKTHPAYYGAYAVSKAALIALVNIYRAETAKTNIITSLICPPPLATEFRRKEFPGEDQSDLLSAEDFVTSQVLL